MMCHAPRRRLRVPLIALVAASAATGARASENTVELAWQHAAPGESFCGDTAGWDTLPCGRHGALRFRRQPAGTGIPGGCRSRAQAAGLGASVVSAPPEALADEGFQPCDQGECFLAPDELPQRPWVAVVDWHNQHGWGVGETITRLSAGAADLKLYPLDRPAVPAIAALAEQVGGQVTSAHVLEQVCRVAEDADRAPRAPLVLNLSFGLVLEGPACDLPDDLNCQIESVLGVLDRVHGVVEVAAAGNHGRQLFPASSPPVFAVATQSLRPVMPDPEPWAGAPPEADVTLVMPGYGMFFDDAASGARWAAPAGSSYAAAVASGWIAYVSIHYPEMAASMMSSVEHQRDHAAATGVRFVSVGVIGDASWAGSPYFVFPLVVSEQTLSAEFRRLLEGALGTRPELCFRGPTRVAYRFGLEPAPPLRTFGVASVVELQAHGFLPSPDAEPCVPCSFHRGRRARSAEELHLDLSAARGTPAGTRLLELALEIEGESYQLTGADRAGFLRAVEEGRAGVVALTGAPPLSAGAAVDLRYLFERLADGALFWDSTPVVFHDHENPLLFADDFESADTLRWDAAP